MQLLFEIDKKDYTEGGTVGRRPSVRGIIVRGGKLAMVHSLKYDYYKLPGGGIDAGETHEETLIREVHEESGLRVIPESIREWGFVRRKQKGKIEDIFIQENFYYFCDAEEHADAQTLDEYEAQAQFTPEWVTPETAIAENERALKETKSDGHDAVMIERENRVLRLLTVKYPELFSGENAETAVQGNVTRPLPGEGFRPLPLSIAAMTLSLLMPLLCGLSCLFFGYHSPMDGGTVTGANAFQAGLLWGCIAAPVPLIISLISLALSRRDRHEAVQKPIVKALSLTALGITLLFLWEVIRIGGE